jgi:hypothetical protein
VLVDSERISLEKHFNREGRLRLEGIPEGSHRVRLRSSRADLDGLETDVRIERGREHVVMFRASPPLRGEIVGRVTVDGKEPRTPVEISLARIGSSGERTPLPRLSTGSRGTFSLNDLEPGTYYAEATVVLDRATYSGGTTIELGVAHPRDPGPAHGPVKGGVPWSTG